MDNLLSLKMDFVFNRLFSKKGNEGLLKDFLESILDIQIHKIEIVPEARLERLSKTNKFGVLDIKATLNNRIVVNVEMQIVDNKDIEKRSLFYAGKLMSEQLSLGEKYRDMKDIIMINILDYEFTSLPDYHTETITVAKKHRNYEMIKSLKYHFIELPKFRKQHPDLNNRLEQWLTFIDGMNKELIQMAIKNNKKIKKAHEELEFLSGDAELKRLEFLKFKAACDEASRIDYLTNKVLKDGMKQGMQKGIEMGIEKGIEKGMKQGVERGMKQGVEQGMKQGIEQGMKQGIEQGMKQGIEQGIQEGIEQGMKQGVEQGIQKGMEQGINQEKIAIAKKMLLKKMNIDTIIEITGLSKVEIENIKQI